MKVKKLSILTITLLLFLNRNTYAKELTLKQDQLRYTKDTSFRYGTPLSFQVELDKKAMVQMMEEDELKVRKSNLPINGAIFAKINVNSSSFEPSDLMVIIKKNNKVIDKRTGDNFESPAKIDFSNGMYNIWGVFEPKLKLEPPFDVYIINASTNKQDVYKVRK